MPWTNRTPTLVQKVLSQTIAWLAHFPWEAWIAFGTWALAIGTWVLALITWNLIKRSQEDAQAQIHAARETAQAQVTAAKKSADEQMAVTERMAKANIETFREDLKTHLLLHYETLVITDLS